MGNQPNNLIQCGQDQRDNKQETLTTRQQAIRNSKNQQLLKSQVAQSKISSTNNSTDLGSYPVVALRQKKLSNKQSTITFIPEHENLTRVSKTPKNKFIIAGSDLFEEQRGKCLDEIIESRYNTTMHFPEYQIHGLLESMVYSLAYMVKKDVNHHDFYPTNIFYNNGAFKVINPALLKSSGYSLTQQRKRFSFLSPELILEILNDTSESNIRKDVMDKSDVFAIGMILLQFCTLVPSSECYDPESYNIIDEVINERVEKTRNLYNPLIADCIDIMLQYEVDKRVSPLDLAYAVHCKVMEIKTDEMNQLSRVNQLSRLAMSKSPQSISPQRVRSLANRPGSFTPPPLQTIPQHLVTSNPQIPQSSLINPNISHVPYFIGSPPSKLLSYPPNLNPQGTLTNLQPVRVLNAGEGDELKKVQNSYYVSQQKNQSPKKYYTNPSENNERNFPTSNIPAKLTPPSLGSNTKLKLNPFEQIQQEIKQDDEQSPQRRKKIQSPSNQDKAKEIKQTALSQSPKFGAYKFKTVQSANLSTAPYVGPQKEQTLDQRVKRILQASKNIK